MRTVRQYLQTAVSVPFKVIVLKTSQLTCHPFTGDLYIQHNVLQNKDIGHHQMLSLAHRKVKGNILIITDDLFRIAHPSRVNRNITLFKAMRAF